MLEHKPAAINLSDFVEAPAAAEAVGVSASTLASWRARRQHLPFYRIGRRVFYKRTDLDAFIEGGRVTVAALQAIKVDVRNG